MDMGGFNLFPIEVVGAVILLAVLLWVVIRTRSKGKETSPDHRAGNPRTVRGRRAPPQRGS